MTATEPDDDKRSTPLGYFNYAESYWRAAAALKRAEAGGTHPEMPVRFLLYHAIELYLKAFLRLHGVTVRELARKAYGHRTDTLAAKAGVLGLHFDDEDAVVIEMMAKTDAVIRSRYHQTGAFRWPSVESLDRTCKSLRDSLGKALRTRGISVRMR